MTKATAVILAAGLGTRMASSLPKALHPIAGRPMLRHLILSCEAVFDDVVVVAGPGMEAVERAAAPWRTVIQHERSGTAHAALQAAPMFGEGLVAVLYADNPLITPETLRRLRDRLGNRNEAGLEAGVEAGGEAGAEAGGEAGGVALALLAMRPPDPGRYGRVITDGEQVERIVEFADATETERRVGLCNAGVFCAPAARLRAWLGAVRPHNAKGEYYLTDIVALARAEQERVAFVEAPFHELRGINSRAELAEAEAEMQTRLRGAAMAAGATLTAPETVFLCADTVLAPDVTVGPHVVFGPGVSVARGVEIRAFCHLEGCRIEAGAVIGPFARLRPGTVIDERAHVGNFVELKAATLGRGAKANHLAYLGDAAIGAGSNIGAGTITCNYDGFAKHRTVIGDGVFIGSDSVLVAPVDIGDGAFVAAGSVITRSVSADAMAFGRARQAEKPGRAAAFRTARRHAAMDRS